MTKKIKVQIPKLYIDVLSTFGILDIISEQNKKKQSFIDVVKLLTSGKVVILDDIPEELDET